MFANKKGKVLLIESEWRHLLEAIESCLKNGKVILHQNQDRNKNKKGAQKR